jgi:DNA-binding XRE family transcriptional regulator
MLHTSRYSCYPTARLAADVGVAKSTISHLVHGRTNPLYSTAARVVKCLERELGHSLDLREVFSEDGSYPTPFVCALVNCARCLPGIVFERDDSKNPGFAFIQAGQWTGDTCEFDLLAEQERSQ